MKKEFHVLEEGPEALIHQEYFRVKLKKVLIWKTSHHEGIHRLLK